MLAFTMQANAQVDAISQYFEQYMDDERFTVVYISSKMFQMVSKLDIDELEDDDAQDIVNVIEDLRGLRILTTEENTMAFYKEAKQKINTKGYEVLMTVRDKGEENVEFLVKENGDKIEELLLLVGGEDDFALISFVGNIDLDKISKLSKSLDVKGMEHLEKIDDQ